jgi:dTDP-4-dehydrorhamnose 3,5-epimerase-like enzyme
MIIDLLDEQIDSITRITSVKGAVRGNHYHKDTHQWTYIIKGKTRVVSKSCFNHDYEIFATEGMLLYHPPGMAHAFEAIEDTEWLVFTKGPRSGDNYESDTFRLEKALI